MSTGEPAQSGEPAFFCWGKQHLAFWRGDPESKFQPVNPRDPSPSASLYARTPRTAGGHLIGPGTESLVRRMYLTPRVHYQGSVMSSDRTPNLGPAGPDTATDRACRVCGPAVISPGLWIVVIPLMPRASATHPIIGVVSVMCGGHGADPQESCGKSTPCSPRTLCSSAGPLTLPEDNFPQSGRRHFLV